MNSVNTITTPEKKITLPPHIVKKLYSLDKMPIIASLGGFKPKEGSSSWFGGNFLFPPNTKWYQCNGKPLRPVVQIITDELGEHSKAFGAAKMIQVFVCDDILELHSDRAKNGDNWLLLEFDNIDNFAVVQSPKFDYPPKPLPIKWGIPERADTPTWEDIENYIDSEGHDIFKYLYQTVTDDSNGEFYPNHGTKVGGYAEYIQYPAFNEKDVVYVFQIASEYKANFGIGDAGNLYIGKDIKTGEWVLSWDCA